jgi:predicted small integral membrane protein DUF2165
MDTTFPKGTLRWRAITSPAIHHAGYWLIIAVVRRNYEQIHRRDAVGVIAVPAAVWISDLTAFPPPASVAGCDRTPERPLDCPSTDRSLRLAADATIYRSRRDCAYGDVIIQRLRAKGYTGSADLTTVAMAKRKLGEADRLDGIVLTMSLCSANGICAICSNPTRNITTRSS